MRTHKILIPFFGLALALGGLAACGDDDGGAECGNGILEGDEECDGDEYAGAVSCESEGFVGGTISCSNSCTIDVSGCNNCGDGVKDDDEECDGSDLGDFADCTDLGYDFGDLACTGQCTFDESGCEDFACLEADFTSMGAMASSDGTDYIYQELVQDVGGTSFLVVVDLYDSFVPGGAGLSTGAHALGVNEEAAWETCAYCVYMSECGDAQCSSTVADYFATEGTLDLTTLGDFGGDFLGGLDSVIFSEWDFQNDEPVIDGDCVDVASQTLDATITEDPDLRNY